MNDQRFRPTHTYTRPHPLHKYVIHPSIICSIFQKQFLPSCILISIINNGTNEQASDKVRQHHTSRVSVRHVGFYFVSCFWRGFSPHLPAKPCLALRTNTFQSNRRPPRINKKIRTTVIAPGATKRSTKPNLYPLNAHVSLPIPIITG